MTLDSTQNDKLSAGTTWQEHKKCSPALFRPSQIGDYFLIIEQGRSPLIFLLHSAEFADGERLSMEMVCDFAIYFFFPVFSPSMLLACVSALCSLFFPPNLHLPHHPLDSTLSINSPPQLFYSQLSFYSMAVRQKSSFDNTFIYGESFCLWIFKRDQIDKKGI